MNKFGKKIKYIFEYIVFLLLTKVLRFLGLERSARWCSILGRKIGPILGVTKIARTNLKSALGEAIDIDSTIDGLWDNFGRYIGEFPFINQLSQKELDKRVKVSGLENVAKYVQSKKPFLLFCAHQANWDFVINGLIKIYPKFGVVYRKANNPYIDKAILQSRADDDNIRMIAKGTNGVKDLVRSIKAGNSIAMLVDQKMNDGIEVPFFGRPAMTAHAIAKLSIQYDYPIVPCQVIRTNGTYFKLVVHPPLSYKKTDNIENDIYNIMLKINQILEVWIRQRPEQWFWFHNRWKK